MEFLKRHKTFFRIIALLFVLSSTALLTNAQKDSINWGENFKVEKNDEIMKVMKVGQHLFLLKRYRKLALRYDYSIEKISLPGLVWKSSIPLEQPLLGPQGSSFNEVMAIDNHLVYFYSAYHPKDKKTYCYADLFDTDGNKIESQKILDEIEIDSSDFKGNFHYSLSDDKKSILIAHTNPFEKYKTEKFFFKIYDKNLDLSWKKEIKLPYMGRNFKISDYKLCNDNIYMLSKFFEEKTKENVSSSRPTNDKSIILVYYKKDNVIKEYDLHLKNKWVSSIKFDLNEHDDLIICGFYSYSDRYGFSGTFYLEIDNQTKKTVHRTLSPISEEFLLQFEREKDLLREKMLTDFYFDHFVIHKNGSVSLFAENFIKTANSVADADMGTINQVLGYEFGNIIVIKLNSDGKIIWENKIMKKQISSDDNGKFSSYCAVEKQDSLFIIFNDNPKNAEGSKRKSEKIRALINTKNSSPFLIKIDAEGKHHSKILEKPSESSATSMHTTQFYQEEINTLYFVGRKGNTMRIGKLKL